ncbi:MAG: hypothetical protein Roseis2KO_23500 [Roseivirga sp.]
MMCLGYFIKSNYLYWIGPELVLVTDLHDFGLVEEGQPAQFYIKYRNEGLMRLRLTDASSDCGCTVVDWNGDKVVPGEMDSVLVAYDTSTPGLINRIVTLQSNSPDSPHAFYVIGNVVPAGSDYLQLR